MRGFGKGLVDKKRLHRSLLFTPLFVPLLMALAGFVEGYQSSFSEILSDPLAAFQGLTVFLVIGYLVSGLFMVLVGWPTIYFLEKLRLPEFVTFVLYVSIAAFVPSLLLGGVGLLFGALSGLFTTFVMLLNRKDWRPKK